MRWYEILVFAICLGFAGYGLYRTTSGEPMRCAKHSVGKAGAGGWVCD